MDKLFFVLLFFGGLAMICIYFGSKVRDDDSFSPKKSITNPTSSSAGVASTPSSQDKYELIQFDQAMFTTGTTEERFQACIKPYIDNGYRIHTINVMVKEGLFATQKQTYSILFEKLPQPMSEGAAMLNS